MITTGLALRPSRLWRAFSSLVKSLKRMARKHGERKSIFFLEDPDKSDCRLKLQLFYLFALTSPGFELVGQ